MNTRWLWYERSIAARLARLPLVPPSLFYRAAMQVRALAYDRKVFRSNLAPVPVISVGNLTVGGTGKTPISSWIANHYSAQGLQTGIVLRDYGHDEAALHRELEPRAIVHKGADRIAGIQRAADDGASVVVLDDAFQRLDVRRDLDILLISAEGANAVSWTLPAGPWREGFDAVDRCDVIVVTRKTAGVDEADGVATGLVGRGKKVATAFLQVEGFEGMLTKDPVDQLAGKTALVVSGVGNPLAFRQQCENVGLRTRELVFPDHHRYVPRDVNKMLHAGDGLDYVVVTAKDAVKLRSIWPAERPEPLVAQLRVHWETGVDVIKTLLAQAMQMGPPRTG